MAFLNETGLGQVWEKIKTKISSIEGTISDITETKVDKVDGKGLSTNDYTTNEKTKLAGIATGATKVIVDSALSSTSTNAIQNKVVAEMKTNIEDQLGDKLSKTGEGASGTWSISISGNAATATKDSAGQQINTTYIKGLSINGKTITYTKGNGTTGTIITQDTDTTYDNMTGATSTAAGAAGLVPAPAAGANLKYLRGDGTWQDVSAITNAEIDEICNATIYDQSEVQV